MERKRKMMKRTRSPSSDLSLKKIFSENLFLSVHKDTVFSGKYPALQKGNEEKETLLKQ